MVHCVRPKVHKSYPQIVSRFPQSCHNLAPAPTMHSTSKIVTRLPNRITILHFLKNTFFSHITTIKQYKGSLKLRPNKKWKMLFPAKKNFKKASRVPSLFVWQLSCMVSGPFFIVLYILLQRQFLFREEFARKLSLYIALAIKNL